MRDFDAFIHAIGGLIDKAKDFLIRNLYQYNISLLAQCQRVNCGISERVNFA
jgi:hypothetical protein